MLLPCPASPLPVPRHVLPSSAYTCGVQASLSVFEPRLAPPGCQPPALQRTTGRPASAAASTRLAGSSSLSHPNHCITPHHHHLPPPHITHPPTCGARWTRCHPCRWWQPQLGWECTWVAWAAACCRMGGAGGAQQVGVGDAARGDEGVGHSRCGTAGTEEAWAPLQRQLKRDLLQQRLRCERAAGRPLTQPGTPKRTQTWRAAGER